MVHWTLKRQVEWVICPDEGQIRGSIARCVMCASRLEDAPRGSSSSSCPEGTIVFLHSNRTNDQV